MYTDGTEALTCNTFSIIKTYWCIYTSVNSAIIDSGNSLSPVVRLLDIADDSCFIKLIVNHHLTILAMLYLIPLAHSLWLPQNQGLNSLSGRTFFLLFQLLWNLTDMSAASLPRCYLHTVKQYHHIIPSVPNHLGFFYCLWNSLFK